MMSVVKLKTLLANKPQKELVAEIAELYKKLDVVKAYYDTQLNTLTEEDYFQQQKAIIQNEFFPRNGFGDGRLSVARKAVMDFKKLFGMKDNLIDLAVFYVEKGVQYTCSYGDISESFYNSMEGMYLKALEWMKELNLLEVYKDRMESICYATSGIGWGFHDQLCYTFDEFYDEEILLNE